MLFFYGLLAIGAVSSGLIMMFLTAIYRSPRATTPKLREPKHRPFDEAAFRRNFSTNSAVSLGTVFAASFVCYPTFFTTSSTSLLRIVWEGVAVLLIYDFLYYFLHRYLFHEWKVLRRVHAVHHVVRTPSAAESLYLHPLEMFLGVALLWVSTGILVAIAGPLSVYSFAWLFVVYSILNVVIHSGLELPSFPFAPINYLAERHQRHHLSMNAGNYASITPIFDLLFRTESKRVD